LYYRVTSDTSLVPQIMNALYQLRIQSVLVEGGARLLQSFIDEGIWDEARIIKNVAHPDIIGKELIINNGLKAPKLLNAKKIAEEKMLSDTIKIYKPKHS
jgi:diaminohydroxyphosphoribosylaminopyrimidine deaminase/5-amino-6-(5-phosphoribosylamino)uracil reductase